MRLEFHELILHNFMSFGDAVFDLRSSGYISITGRNKCSTDGATSNGSGKSAIFEGLYWCLIGTTMRGSKEVTRRGFDDCFVTLKFVADSHCWVIRRGKEANKSTLYLEKDGVDISNKGIRDTEAELQKQLPELTDYLINSTILLGQGLPMRFSSNSPSGRKEMLEQLSHSDYMISDLKQRVQRRTSELSSTLRATEDSLLDRKARLDLLSERLNALTASLEEINNADVLSIENEITTIEENILKIGERIDYCTTNSDAISGLQESLLKLGEEESLEVEAKTKELSVEVEAINQSISEKTAKAESVKAEILRLKSVRDVCPTCGQKIPGVVKIDTSDLENQLLNITNLLADSKEKRQKLEEEIRDCISNIGEGYSIKKQDITSKINECMSLISEIAPLSNKRSILEKNVLRLKNLIESKEVERRKISSEIENTTLEMDKLQSLIQVASKEREDLSKRLSIQKDFDTYLKRDFRGILLKNCISYVDRVAKEYSESIFGTNLVSIALDGNVISIKYSGKEYESLSGGEKKKVDLVVQFAIRNMLCKYLDFYCNILVLDEVFDELDSYGCGRVVDFISNNLAVETVFVISHRPDLNLPSDRELIIEKDSDGISRIV